MIIKQYFLSLFTIILLVVISCKKTDNSKVDKMHSDKDSIQKNILETEPINLKYSDSVFIGTYEYGVINYNKKIKDIKKSNILERYVLLYVSVDENAKTFEDIKKTKQNEFIDTIGNGVFYFKYKFNKIGKNNLKLVFDDFVNYLKDDSIKRDDTITMIRHSTPISLPVYVLDSSSIIGYKGDTAYFVGMKKFSSKRKDSARILREAQQKIDSMKKVLNN